MHVAEEHLVRAYSGLSALHGDECGGGGLVVGTYCQQLNSSDAFKDP